MPLFKQCVHKLTLVVIFFYETIFGNVFQLARGSLFNKIP